MKNPEKLKELLKLVLERSQTMEAALETLRYSMEAFNDIDFNEYRMRMIACNIADSIECLIEYQRVTVDNIDKNKGEVISDKSR